MNTGFKVKHFIALNRSPELKDTENGKDFIFERITPKRLLGIPIKNDLNHK